MKKNLIIALFLSLIVTFSDLSAQDFEFRFVDKQGLITNLYQQERNTIDREVRGFYEYSNQNLEKIMGKIYAQRSKIERLDGKEQEEAYKKLIDLNEEFNSEETKVKNTMQEMRSEFLNQIKKKVDDAIQEIAKRDNIDYIIPTTDEEDNLIIRYVSAEKAQLYNITSKVMEYLDNK